MANGPADNLRWERLFLKVVELEEVSGWVSQIFLQAQELDHTHQIMWTYFKRRMTAKLRSTVCIFWPWKSPLGMTESLIFIQKIHKVGWETLRQKIQSIDCTDNLTHHMPHWLSSCYQSVCISPTLHDLPVLVNMPHTRYPTAWKRVQRSIKNF